MSITKGFQLPRRTAKLVFKGDFQGAEVSVYLDIPLGVVLSIMEALAKADETPNAETALESIGIYKTFAEAALVSWNLEDQQGPIPATAEGMRRVTPAFANILIQQWVEVVANPPAPLGEPSSNGSTSGVSIPATAATSGNLGSSSVPSS